MWCLGLALLARRAAVCLRLRLEGTSSSSSSIIRANNSENLSKYKICNYWIQVLWSLSCSSLRFTHKTEQSTKRHKVLRLKIKKKIYKMRSIMSLQKAAYFSGQLVKVARRYRWPFLICSLCLFTRYFCRLEVLAYSLNHVFVSKTWNCNIQIQMNRVYSLYMYLSPLTQHSFILNCDSLLLMHSKVKALWCYYVWLWAYGKCFELLHVCWGYQHILAVGRSCQHILLIMTYFCFCNSLLDPCACCKADCTVSFVKTAKTNTSTMNSIQLKHIEGKYTCIWIIWLCSRHENFHR